MSSSLDSEAVRLARRSGQECKSIRDALEAYIESANARLAALEAGGGGGGDNSITYTGGVASTETDGGTIYWLASETDPDA